MSADTSWVKALDHYIGLLPNQIDQIDFALPLEAYAGLSLPLSSSGGSMRSNRLAIPFTNIIGNSIC